MPLQFANNAVSILPASVLLTDTVFSITAGHGARFPTLTAGDTFLATIQFGTAFEIIEVTARTGDTFVALRGREGTAAQTWAAGSTINMRFTAGTARSFAQRSELSPVGHILVWPTNTPPARFLFCNGEAVSRTTYAALYAVLGNTFGAGNGTTTFNLPDMRGRVPVGRDDMGVASAARVSAVLASTTLGAAGGDQNLHAHAHGVSDPGHAHGVHDPGHSHHVSDPGHSHGVHDPGHSHQNNNMSIRVPGSYPIQAGPGGASLEYEFLVTNRVGTGISIHGAGTGIWLHGAGTNVGVHAATTGLSVHGNGAGTQQNIQPSIIMNYIIFAGV